MVEVGVEMEEDVGEKVWVGVVWVGGCREVVMEYGVGLGVGEVGERGEGCWVIEGCEEVGGGVGGVVLVGGGVVGEEVGGVGLVGVGLVEEEVGVGGERV